MATRKSHKHGDQNTQRHEREHKRQQGMVTIMNLAVRSQTTETISSIAN